MVVATATVLFQRTIVYRRMSHTQPLAHWLSVCCPDPMTRFAQSSVPKANTQSLLQLYFTSRSSLPHVELAARMKWQPWERWSRFETTTVCWWGVLRSDWERKVPSWCLPILARGWKTCCLGNMYIPEAVCVFQYHEGSKSWMEVCLWKNLQNYKCVCLKNCEMYKEWAH